MTLLEELKLRGFIHQCTDEKGLDIELQKSINFYIGFDCTAKSLHVGSLIQIMMMRIFQKYGHTPIVLIGEGTTKIGDPSGKDESRKMLSTDDIKLNASNLKSVFNKYLDSNCNNKTIYANNSDWLDNINYIDFLRDYGKHFTINKMLSFDSVKLRLEREQSLSFVEFNYMILQAYDFLELNTKHNCTLQIGGSDQWGNIVNGVELIKRYSNKQAFGLTTHLITLASGAKMGKTEKGAIWLDKKFLSPYDYWQFWRNTDDKDVVRFLKYFTDIKIEEIEKIKDKNINDLKVVLANSATTMLHGKQEALNSQKTAKEAFSIDSLGSNLPTVKIKKDIINRGVNIIDLIVLSKLVSSKSEIRRLIKGKAIKINNKTISNEKLVIDNEILNENYFKLSIGKKRHLKIELN